MERQWPSRQPDLKLMNTRKGGTIFKKRHPIYEKVLKNKGNSNVCLKVQPMKAQRAHTEGFFFFNPLIRF